MATIPKLPIEEVKFLIKYRLTQQLRSPDAPIRPLYIEGHAGIGKTQIVRQCAEEFSIQYKDALKGAKVEAKTLNLQFMERPDFMGLGYVDENKKTRFATPLILPTEGFGILFLDEANRVDKDIRSGMLTLLEDRDINGHKLGKGWIVVLAGNPSDTPESEGQYEVGEFDTALRDRVAVVELRPTVEGLLKYLQGKYPDNSLVRFLGMNKSFVSFNGKGISPRSFEYGIKATLGLNLEKHQIQRLLEAEFGVEMGLLAASSATTLVFTYDHLLTATQLVGNRDFLAAVNKNDSVMYLLNELSTDFERRTEHKTPYSQKEIDNIKYFLRFIPAEHRISMVAVLKDKPYLDEFFKVFIKGTELHQAFNAIFNRRN